MSYNSRSVMDTFNRMAGTIIGTRLGHIPDDYDQDKITSCYAAVCQAIASRTLFLDSAEIVLLGSSVEQAEAIHVVVSDETGLIIDPAGEGNRIEGGNYICVSKYPGNPKVMPIVGRISMEDFYKICQEAWDKAIVDRGGAPPPP